MVLGREVPKSEEGSYGSFAEITVNDLEDFRILGKNSSILAISYIRYKLKGKVDLNTAVAFYAVVIEQGVPLQTWIDEN